MASASDKDWNEVANRYGTDKGTNEGRGHGYMDDYQRLLAGKRVTSVLEIGVQGGNSLRLWAEVFPDAQIIGVDIDPTCAAHAGERITVEIADVADEAKMRELAERYGPFDLIVDDGSHYPPHIQATYAALAGSLREGGVYVVEDVTGDVGIAGEMIPDRHPDGYAMLVVENG